MKTKTIKLYTYDELSKEAKEKALNKFIENNDYFALSDCMNERLHEFLEENKIKDCNDTSKAGTKPTQVLYSLSHSQGDGAMFEGEFEWKKYTVYIKQYGRYYHSNSAGIELQETNNLGFHMDDEHKDVKTFEQIYNKICKQLEQYGYDFVDHEDSEEFFKEECEANEWTFRSNGVMENA